MIVSNPVINATGIEGVVAWFHGGKESGYHTQTGGEEHHVQVCDKLLGVGVEEALLGDNVAGQADTDDLQDGLEDEEQ